MSLFIRYMIRRHPRISGMLTNALWCVGVCLSLEIACGLLLELQTTHQQAFKALAAEEP